MISLRQLAANRRNAQKSTGPRTPEGKSASSFNSLRHGLYAQEVVLPGEDRAAFEALLAGLRADFEPASPVEDGLIERLASIWWRLRRTAAVEAGLLSPDWHGSADPAGPLIRAFRIAVDETATLDRLGRYEGRLERAFSGTINTLTRIQGMRRRRQKKVKKEAQHASYLRLSTYADH